NTPSAFLGEDFQDGARPSKPPLGWLIGVGRRADGNGLALVSLPQFAAQDFAHAHFGMDTVLELSGVELHEFVRIAGITVLTSEFAAVVRVDAPAEWHSRPASIQNAACRNLEILDPALGLEQIALRRHFGNAYQTPIACSLE